MYRSAAWRVGSTAPPKLRQLSLTHHHQCARRCPDSRWTETENITARVPSTSALEILIKEHLTVPSASSLTSNLNSIPTSLSVPNTTAKSVIIFDRKYRSDKAFQRMNKAHFPVKCPLMKQCIRTKMQQLTTVIFAGLQALTPLMNTCMKRKIMEQTAWQLTDLLFKSGVTWGQLIHPAGYMLPESGKSSLRLCLPFFCGVMK
ncbi:uncharacterized protein [Mobula birostris]|uniref:uncharacterized protein n=1 Tax=Mobula birostris TaxID=1983395 RepID=UPI003B28991B